MKYVNYNNHIKNIDNTFTSNLSKIGIRKSDINNFVSILVNDYRSTLEKMVLDTIVLEGGLQVYDAFNNKVTLNGNYNELIKSNISLIIDTKLQYEDIKLSEALLYTNKRFSIIYETRETNNKKITTEKLINFPPDVFRFLLDNGYDSSIIYQIKNGDFIVQYNFVEVFNKVLRMGKQFKEKSELLDISDNVLNFVTTKYNKLKPSELYEKAMDILGRDGMTNLTKKSTALGIHLDTIYYRLYTGMSLNDAIKLGMEEAKKYNIDSQINALNVSKLKHLFYTIAREYMKELGVDYNYE